MCCKQISSEFNTVVIACRCPVFRKRESICTCVIFLVIAVVSLVSSVLSISLNIVYLRTSCPDVLSVEVLHNDTIRTSDFSSCLSGVTIKRDDANKGTVKVSGHDCRELEGKLHEHHVLVDRPLANITRGCYAVYNHINGSNYFANTLDGFLSVSATAKFSADVSTCIFDSEDSYRHYNSEDPRTLTNEDSECELLMHATTEKDFKNFPITRDASSKYYFITICTTEELSHMEYTFRTIRKYYNENDFVITNSNSCTIQLGSSYCTLSSADCLLLNVEPLIQHANFSKFTSSSFTGLCGSKEWLLYGLYVCSNLFCFLFCNLFPFLL